MSKIIYKINNKQMFKTITLISLISLTLSACSTQQVIGAGVTIAKVPVKAAGSVAGAAGGVVGGTVGGLVAGRTGAKYGKMAGQRAAKKAIP